MRGRDAPRGDRRATRGCDFKCSFLGPAPVLPEPKLGKGEGGAESRNLVWELMSVPFEMEAQPCSVLRHSLNHAYFKTTLKSSYFSISFAIGRHDPFFFKYHPSIWATWTRGAKPVVRWTFPPSCRTWRMPFIITREYMSTSPLLTLRWVVRSTSAVKQHYFCVMALKVEKIKFLASLEETYKFRVELKFHCNFWTGVGGEG